MPTSVWRIIGWTIVSTLFAFLLNNYLVNWLNWPGLMFLFEATSTQVTDQTGLAWAQAAIYLAAFIGSVAFVMKSPDRVLRDDSEQFTKIGSFIVRAAFWSVLLIGFVDATISFLRVEGFLVSLFGDEIATSLGRPQYRSPVIHMPLMVLSIVIACFVRSLGFTWLALLVVVAELMIVFSRFVFSYEQAFMGDLVRFWYAALFLFASAYTLLEEGHVRVDVMYAGFTEKKKGLINAVGSIVLGATLCIVILVLGMEGKANIINAPLLSYEVSQSGFGMYVKYMMAGFLAIFAISMLIQFAASFLSGIADYRGEPGGRKIDNALTH